MAEVITRLLDSPQWDWLNKKEINGKTVPVDITQQGKYAIFADKAGPNCYNSNPIANQFSSTSDYQMARYQFNLYPHPWYTDLGASQNTAKQLTSSLQSFLMHSWLRLTINKQEVLNDSLMKLFAPTVLLTGVDRHEASKDGIGINDVISVGSFSHGGIVSGLKGVRNLASSAPIVFPGGQSFQFELIVCDGYSPYTVTSGEDEIPVGFYVHFGCDGFEMLREGTQRV